MGMLKNLTLAKQNGNSDLSMQTEVCRTLEALVMKNPGLCKEVRCCSADTM